MHQRLKLFVWVMILVASGKGVEASDVAATAAPSGRFVRLFPCRILDTAAQPAKSAVNESVRRVSIKNTRCGQVVPPYATTVSLKVTTYQRTAPEKLPAGTLPVVNAIQASPSATGLLDFSIPPSSFVAVDVDGYYVPAGTPVNPVDSGAVGAADAPSVGVTRQSTNSRPGLPEAEVFTGTSGSLDLDSPAELSSAGAILKTSTAARPWIVVKGSTTDGTSGFAFANSANAELMHIRSDGAVQLAGAAFFDGRTDFFGSPGTPASYLSVPTNVVHDVTLINPRDANGAAVQRLTFFNAQSGDEYGSPAITKFNASTLGFYAQENVNYDSSILYHRGDQYHYRARSTYENKDTFWIKAATSFDSITNTRADMYVSGNVGIGRVPAGHALEVSGAPSINGAAREVLGVYDLSAWNQSPGAALALGGRFNSTGDIAQQFASIQGFKENTTDGNYAGALSFNTRVHGANPAEQMRITSNGNVGIGTTNPAAKLDVNGNINVSGNINAKFQDLAEWVPASEAMPAGTVVVLNLERNNQVMPSAAAYDTAVAGVVSAQPGIVLGEAGVGKAKIATTGRVRVRVDATAGPIRVGDLLVSSHKPGVAMRSEPIVVAGVKLHRPGTLIGKALEPLAGGEGEILVLLSLQ